MTPEKIQLGQHVRDTVTGFEGIAVTIAEHLHGCRRVGIRPQETDENGEMIDTHFVDEPRCEVVDNGLVELAAQQNAEMPAAGPAGKDSSRKVDSA